MQTSVVGPLLFSFCLVLIHKLYQLQESSDAIIAHLWFDLDLRTLRTLSLVFSLITHANSLQVKSIFRSMGEQTVLLAKRTQGITPAHTKNSYRKLRFFLMLPFVSSLTACRLRVVFFVEISFCFFSLKVLRLFWYLWSSYLKGKKK